jgi:hypothetical protein
MDVRFDMYARLAAAASGVVLAAFATTPLATARSGHHPNSPCVGGATLKRNLHVRVFRKRIGEQSVVFACASGGKRAVRLGALDPETPSGVDSFAIDGVMVGYHRYTCDHGGLCEMSVGVVNARTRKQVRTSSSAEGFVRSLVVSATGSAAWIRVSGLGLGVFVTAMDPNGERNLDQGREIDPTSLALGGHHVYWLNAGQANGAQLD